MRATSLAALLLLSYIFAVVAARAIEEDTGVGPPPALAPGQAPPLPRRPFRRAPFIDSGRVPHGFDKWYLAVHAHDLQSRIGQKLFFEARLSGDGAVACATCHDPVQAFTDGRPVSVGPWPRRPTQRANRVEFAR